jgi:oligopeptide transport system ATP-binding protein
MGPEQRNPSLPPQPSSGPDGASLNGPGPLVRVEKVVKHFPARVGLSVKAVDGVSFEIEPGECLGLVGESGCGKSTLGRLISQLIPVTSGSIHFDGTDLTRQSGRGLRGLRRDFQMIFQDPFASLDPRMTVGGIIAEPLSNYGVGGRDREQRVQELLRVVGLNPNFVNRYPHEFSGGQRQRIGIARALALKPRLIVCDEPVSALDVSIQGQIINLLEDLQRDFHLTYLFIAHDLAVVRHISHRVMVMYLGKIVEIADSAEIYTNPRHPYTRALLSSVPVPDPRVERQRTVIPLTGEIPSPIDPPSGCRFHTRCPIARAPGICSEQEPPLERKADGHWAACHFSDKVPVALGPSAVPRPAGR